MKILYGVQSTGNGHITRSSKIVQRLSKSGCRVDIITSGNNSKVNFPFPIKYNLRGLTFYYDGIGQIDYWKTFKQLKLLQLMRDVKLDISSYDLIVSDFEPISAWAAEFQGKISVGVSNQYSFLSKNTPRPTDKNLVGEFLLKWMAPVKHPIGLHFEEYDNFIKTPILRDNIYNFEVSNKGHYTVYLSNWTSNNIIQYLKPIQYKFEIFTDVKRPVRYGNCFLKPVDKSLFDESLKNCIGVITAGGFQTCAESLYLNKELIVLPIKNQYEQLCNVESLKRMGVKTGNINEINTLLNLPRTQKNVIWKDPTEQIVDQILNLGIE
jgi:uncharacterized protein (TIGR00661 family)